MASSAAKIESNRANAQLSTGPTTEAGKQVSSRNAEKHNLTGGSAFVEGEDRERYEIHCQRQFRQYKPICEHEIFLVTEMADAMWRLKRAHRMENELIAASANPYLEDSEKLAIQLQRLTRYIAALERTYYKAYNEVKRIKKERSMASSFEYGIHKCYEHQPLDVANQALERASHRPDRSASAMREEVRQLMQERISARLAGRSPSRE